MWFFFFLFYLQVTCLTVHENLNWMAVGFQCGSVVLFKGDVTRDRSVFLSQTPFEHDFKSSKFEIILKNVLNWFCDLIPDLFYFAKYFFNKNFLLIFMIRVLDRKMIYLLLGILFHEELKVDFKTICILKRTC